MLVTALFKSISPTVISLNRSVSYYITTPIFYVNSSPHIGHVHTLFLADAINIYNRLKLGTNDTVLSTGTDEHGIKIQTAAAANNMSCRDFCDLNATKFANLFKQYNTTVTDFVRTTEDRHKKSVQNLWHRLNDNGFIYSSTYSGWYCASDEVFVPESQVTTKDINGQTLHVDAHDNKVVWSSEINYMFKLGDIEHRVVDWLMTKQPILPIKFNNDLVEQLKRSPIGDISISRPKERLGWGIEVPDDPSQTIYVWLDALASYLTVAGHPCKYEDLRRWPIDCQVLGKDIIKFHAVYWPAFLLALSLPLPKRLLCHSHWLVDSLKMSKSRGNVVDPWCENEALTLEGLRYYLLRASTTHSDTDYSRTQAMRRVNAELAGTYGNLLSRSCAPAINPDRKIPLGILDSDQHAGIDELISKLKVLGETCSGHFEKADFYKGVDEIMSVLRFNNKVYQDAEPWSLVKDMGTNSKSRLMYHNTQAVTFETLRICSILLQPIVPNMAKTALDHIDVKDRLWKDSQLKLDCMGTQEAYRSICNHRSPVLFKKIKE